MTKNLSQNRFHVHVILSEAKDLIMVQVGTIRFFGLRPQNDISSCSVY